MSFLVDTDTASAYIRQVASVRNRFLQYTGQLYVSTIVLAELKIWLFRKKTPQKFRQELPHLEQQIHIEDVNSVVAQKAGEVGADLLDRGIIVATPDLLIAATALVLDFTLATHNTQDYVQILGLRLVDWLVP
jgi:predicted nucleic acid-binding protein